MYCYCLASVATWEGWREAGRQAAASPSDSDPGGLMCDHAGSTGRPAFTRGPAITPVPTLKSHESQQLAASSKNASLLPDHPSLCRSSVFLSHKNTAPSQLTPLTSDQARNTPLNKILFYSILNTKWFLISSNALLTDQARNSFHLHPHMHQNKLPTASTSSFQTFKEGTTPSLFSTCLRGANLMT